MLPTKCIIIFLLIVSTLSNQTISSPLFLSSNYAQSTTPSTTTSETNIVSYLNQPRIDSRADKPNITTDPNPLDDIFDFDFDFDLFDTLANKEATSTTTEVSVSTTSRPLEQVRNTFDKIVKNIRNRFSNAIVQRRKISATSQGYFYPINTTLIQYKETEKQPMKMVNLKKYNTSSFGFEKISPTNVTEFVELSLEKNSNQTSRKFKMENSMSLNSKGSGISASNNSNNLIESEIPEPLEVENSNRNSRNMSDDETSHNNNFDNEEDVEIPNGNNLFVTTGFQNKTRAFVTFVFTPFLNIWSAAQRNLPWSNNVEINSNNIRLHQTTHLPRNNTDTDTDNNNTNNNNFNEVSQQNFNFTSRIPSVLSQIRNKVAQPLSNSFSGKILHLKQSNEEISSSNAAVFDKHANLDSKEDYDKIDKINQSNNNSDAENGSGYELMDLLQNTKESNNFEKNNQIRSRMMVGENLGIYILELFGTIVGLTWGALSTIQNIFGRT